MKWQGLKSIIFLFFLSLVIISLIIYGTYADQLNTDTIGGHVYAFGIWTPVVFVLIYILGTVFLPSTPFMLLAGILFGFEYGLLYTVIGGSLGSFLSFSISRLLGKSFIDKIIKNNYLKYLDSYNDKLESNAIFRIMILRMIPVMPFNILNIILGISKTNKKDYFLGTIIGLLPSNIITVYAGTLITKVF